MNSKLLLWFVCVATVCLSRAADLKIQAEPAFVGFGQSTGIYPIAVTLRNLGPDARGALRVTAEKFQMDYPVELPKGSVKRIVAYPQINYGAEVELNLSTDQGQVHSTFRQLFTGIPNAQNALLIGDNEGDLAFLRGRQDTPGRMVDSYVKPDNAPERPIAYAGFCAVVLGQGAERISDGAVRALHLFAMSGGTVVFLGGASSPTLADRRWADIVPVHAKLPKTLARSSYLANFDKTPLTGPFTIPDSEPAGDPIVIREGSDILVAKRGIGLGKTLYYAFNPLEAPFTRWPGRRTLFERTIKPLEGARAVGYLRTFEGSNDQREQYLSGRYGYYYSGGPYSGSATTTTFGEYDTPGTRDPFSTKLPESKTVLIILSLYFVTIIPLNFLVLKKLKKGELAWFTAPLISVAFAGAFFAEAKDLYSARLSKATQGLIVQTADSPESLFFGRSQMFFPRGGEYKLDVDGLEKVGTARPVSEYGYMDDRDDPGLEEVNPVDTGHVTIDHMSVGNLSFRELSFEQVLPLGKLLRAQLEKTDDGSAIRVTNLSRYSLEGVSAVVAGATFPLKALGPGESASIPLPASIQEQTYDNGPRSYGTYGRLRSGASFGQEAQEFSGLDEITSGTKEIVVKAILNSAPVGPKLGNLVSERQQVYLAVFTGLHYGERAL